MEPLNNGIHRIHQNQTIISLTNVSFAYGDAPILRDVGLTVCQGDSLAIAGANGTGKSTLLQLILGELAPDSGEILWFAEDVRRFKGWPRVGYMPQHNLLAGNRFPATALEIVAANLYDKVGLFRFPSRAHKQKALDTLALVGLEAQAHTLVGELSGGQQQRVMLARALVNDPAVLILDEPANGVDEKSVLSLYGLLEKCNREGLTIVMVTHDLERCCSCVHRTLYLRNGGIAPEEGAVQNG